MIRKATINDFDYIYGLYMDNQINPYLLYEPMQRAEFRPIFNDLVEKGVKYIFSDGVNDIGMFKLVPLTYRTSHICYLGGVAIHPDFGGKGLGLKMMNEIVKYAKEQGFKRIELSTATFNEKAIKLYEKAGFQKEGVLRNYTHLVSEGMFIDEVLMAILL